MKGTTRRAVVLFAKSKPRDPSAHRLDSVRSIYDFAHERVARAVGRLDAVELVLAGPTRRPALARNARIVRQRGRTYAERFENVFRDVRALGHSCIVAVSEGLAVDEPVLRASFDGLERRDFVLGRSPNGGVYLVGTRLPIEHRFACVRWKTQHEADDLARSAGEAFLLPEPGPEGDRFDARLSESFSDEFLPSQQDHSR